jgi:hypothetical protein
MMYTNKTDNDKQELCEKIKSIKQKFFLINEGNMKKLKLEKNKGVYKS